jgi:nitroimidazol reductase NimA-like FMN-containing flavoprotein (pyridoxamine 5'-phosphate oxidase superfamily)
MTRDIEQRKQDTLHRLEQDVDAWVATAGPDGPYLVPLSFLWDGTTFLLATSLSSPTGRNLRAEPRVRMGIGATRDVVLVEGTVTETAPSTEQGDAFAAHTGFDPRTLRSYGYFRVVPERIQAWREEDELVGRDLMRNGAWLG